MNHPYFYLSIAALAPFYCIFFLSLIRDIIRSHDTGGPDDNQKKPPRPTNNIKPPITSIFMAHWVTCESGPANPSKLFSSPPGGPSSLLPLSVN